ncbi:unnamed protein product [Caenorhabditis auriculariae]|uniref:G-protein coupled receptors family 1 profile domain-containing protein n=1 Tax=Caenorhabditis auriculariae TaxID=2777116 RepID=A0A8S1HIY4_9PELO|nr:unnamed protein product [Caenorhabditis auriculariae]
MIVDVHDSIFALNASLGVFFNLLLFSIAWFTPLPSKSKYRRLVLLFAAFNVFYSLIHVILKPIMYVKGEKTFFMVSSALLENSKGLGIFGILVYDTFIIESHFLLFVNFLYRYSVLSSRRDCAILISLSILVVSIYLILSLMFLADGVVDEEVREEIQEAYNIVYVKERKIVFVTSFLMQTFAPKFFECMVYAAFVTESHYLIFVNLLYRYLLMSRKAADIKSQFSRTDIGVLALINLVLTSVLLYFIKYFKAKKSIDHQIVEEIQENHMKDIYMFMGFLSVSFFIMVSILVVGFKTYKLLNHHAANLPIQKQIFNAILCQSVTPFFTGLVPSITLFASTFFEVNLGFYINILFVFHSLQPVLDPLFTLLLIKVYREKFFTTLLCGKNCWFTSSTSVSRLTVTQQVLCLSTVDRANLKDVFMYTGLLSVILFIMVSMMIIGFKTYKLLNQHVVNLPLQKQIFHAIICQSVAPFFLGLVPTMTVFSSTLLEFNLGIYTNVLFVFHSFQPIVDPLFTLLLIKIYREQFFSIMLCARKHVAAPGSIFKVPEDLLFSIGLLFILHLKLLIKAFCITMALDVFEVIFALNAVSGVFINLLLLTVACRTDIGLLIWLNLVFTSAFLLFTRRFETKEFSDRQMYEEIKSTFHVEITRQGFFYAELSTNNLVDVFMLAGLLSVLFTIIVLMMIVGFKTYKLLNQHVLNLPIQKQIFQAIICQSFTPLFLGFLPSLFVTACTLFDVNLGIYQNFLFVFHSLQPVVDPLFTLILIKLYREKNNLIDVLMLCGILSETFIVLLLMMMVGFKTYNLLNQYVLNLPIQKQIFHAIICQSVTPFFLELLPPLVVFICTLANFNLGMYQNFIFVSHSFLPVFDPFFTLFFIRIYRKKILYIKGPKVAFVTFFFIQHDWRFIEIMAYICFVMESHFLLLVNFLYRLTIFICTLFDVNLGIYTNFLLVFHSLQPVVDPLFTLFMIKIYREKVFSFILSVGVFLNVSLLIIACITPLPSNSKYKILKNPDDLVTLLELFSIPSLIILSMMVVGYKTYRLLNHHVLNLPVQKQIFYAIVCQFWTSKSAYTTIFLWLFIAFNPAIFASNAALGVFLNVLLLAVAWFTPLPSNSKYKNLVIIFATFNVPYSVLHVTLKPIVYIQGPKVAFVTSFFVQHEDRFIEIMTYMTFVLESHYLLLINFIYRYSLISRKATEAGTIFSHRNIAVFLALNLFFTSAFLFLTKHFESSELTDLQMVEDIQRMFHVEIRNHGFFYAELSKNNLKDVFTLAGILGVFSIILLSMISIGLKTYKVLNKHALKMPIHKQISHAILYQSIAPFFLGFLPSLIVIICTLSDVDLGVHHNFLFVFHSLQPVVDPLFTLLLIKLYRILSVLFVIMVSMMVVGFKTYKLLNQHVLHLPIQKQIFHAIICQSVAPFILGFFPGFVAVLCTYLGIQIGIYINSLLVFHSFQPVVDPLFTLLLIKVYRRKALSILLCKNEPSLVSTSVAFTRIAWATPLPSNNKYKHLVMIFAAFNVLYSLLNVILKPHFQAQELVDPQMHKEIRTIFHVEVSRKDFFYAELSEKNMKDAVMLIGILSVLFVIMVSMMVVGFKTYKFLDQHVPHQHIQKQIFYAIICQSIAPFS